MTTSTHNLNILILGGSGFVSGTLARLAVSRGHRVWAVTRGQRPLPEGVIGLVADRKDTPALESAIRAPGVRWNLVADCIAYEEGDIRQNIALFRERADQMVFISTDFVFDPQRRRFPQPEESDHYLSDGYGGLKRRAELALMAEDTGAMKWTILRPCHIYGPGSELGCLPFHGRDPQIISRLRAGETLRLAGGGHFLQQPIFARDLAETILSAAGNAAACGRIFQAAGPDIVESRDYYRIIADALGVDLKIEEVPVDRCRAEHPETASFLCHRIYDLSRLAACGLSVPSTPIRDGLCQHLESLLARA
ncbi:MAG: NAD-dependent epimerase/dehydratase family protein [Armatimonadetes bacterium]|nr:NAD-dependent epimerase/dehydratase family protein [Armatimonadota bacterium]